jgi:hypothetical protein
MRGLSQIKRFYAQEDAPYYWAGIAVIGHNTMQQKYHLCYYVLSGIFLLLGIFLFLKMLHYLISNFRST